MRLARRPATRTAWCWAYLLGGGLGLVAVRDHEVAPPRGRSLEVRADALWLELVCETPMEHWGIGLEAFGVRLDDPDDALRGERGERVPVGLDLEWEVLGPPAALAVEPGETRVEQPGRVRGEVLVGSARVTLDGLGVRDHAWGPRRWWGPGWRRASFLLGDPVAGLTAIGAVAGPGHGPGDATGFRWRSARPALLGGPAEPAGPVDTGPAELVGPGELLGPGAPGATPAAGRATVGSSSVAFRPLGRVVIPVPGPAATSVLTRVLCRADDGSDRGHGWYERLAAPDDASSPGAGA